MSREKADRDKFENVAKDLGCDESEGALDKAIDKLNVQTDKEDPKKEDKE